MSEVLPSVLSPIKYPGGKGLWVPHLLPLMPATGITEYVEPFLGGGAMAFAVARTRPDLAIRVNDLSRPLIDFYQTLQSAEASADMIEQLLAWHSMIVDDVSIRRLWGEVGDLMHEGQSQTMRGGAFWFWNRMSYGGAASAGISFDYIYRWRPTGAQKIRELATWTPLMRNMVITCGDYEPVMRKAGEGAFEFADPPYEQAGTLYGQGNRRSNESFDQQRIQGVLETGTGAKMVVTFNEEMRGRYPLWSGRQLVERRTSMVHHRGKRHELVLMNFTPALQRGEQSSPVSDRVEVVEAALKRMHLTPPRLAKELGVTPRAVQFWLAGEREVPNWVIKQLV